MKKKITKMVLIMVVMSWTHVVFGQSHMKAPERFKLKNGLTFIVAENVGSGKIYTRITVENEISEEQKIYAQVLDTFLLKQANQFNEKQLGNGKFAPQLTMAYNEVNSASNIFNFEQTLAYASQIFFNPSIAREAFADLQASGNQELLAKVKLSGLQQFHASQFKASDIYITIAGDINPSNAKAIANRIFGDMKQETFQLAE